MKHSVGRMGVVAGVCAVVVALGQASTDAGCNEGPRAEDKKFCLDTNGDGIVAMADGVHVLNFLFLGNPSTTDDLNCNSHAHEAPHLCAEIESLESELRATRTELEATQQMLARCRMSRLPATGAKECSNAEAQVIVECPPPGVRAGGQDGFYRSGCPAEGRFADNRDGTVTDACTGLMWQRKTAAPTPGGVHDPDRNGWMNWEQALDYCAALGEVPGIDQAFDGAGYTDWRLPNVRELQSLIDFSRRSPALPPEFEIRSDPTAPAMWYASSTPGVLDDESRKYFWMVSLAYGSVDAALKTDQPYVLAVRSLGPAGDVPATGQTKCFRADGVEIACDNVLFPGQDGSYKAGCPREGRFVVNDSGTPENRSDDTVIDTCTGLVWQREPALPTAATFSTIDGYLPGPNGIVDWQHALIYCETLTFAGEDDWRLPNEHELISINDYGRVPALAAEFGVRRGAFDACFWSSTTTEQCTSLARGVCFAPVPDPEPCSNADGGAGAGSKTQFQFFVRAVRGP